MARVGIGTSWAFGIGNGNWELPRWAVVHGLTSALMIIRQQLGHFGISILGTFALNVVHAALMGGDLSVEGAGRELNREWRGWGRMARTGSGRCGVRREPPLCLGSVDRIDRMNKIRGWRRSPGRSGGVLVVAGGEYASGRTASPDA